MKAFDLSFGSAPAPRLEISETQNVGRIEILMQECRVIQTGETKVKPDKKIC